MPRDAFVLKIQRELCQPKYARKVPGRSRNRPQARVTRSMISANQRSLPEKCIGINTSEIMASANDPWSPRTGKAFPLEVVGSMSVMFQRLFDF